MQVMPLTAAASENHFFLLWLMCQVPRDISFLLQYSDRQAALGSHPPCLFLGRAVLHVELKVLT